MLIKKIIFTSMFATMIAAPAWAQEVAAFATTNDLVVVNNTDEDSTAVINNGACSSKLPNGVGVSHRRTTNHIPGNIVDIACLANRTRCTADVYMTNNCSGPIVAKVIFDTKKGIQDVQPSDQNKYKFTGETNTFVSQIDYK
ncbi:MAG: hypothetical protein ACD_46C00053G0001 [uncultured bacterium]|nr:MAG: hypothetical protein ACD_46C00053G0001 [uncultured bacterium]